MLKNLGLPELKRLILVKSGIRVISPSDCKAISISIQKELKKNISETTLKRLFGFAESKHDFSKFTINTLNEYVQSLTAALPNGTEYFVHDELSDDLQQVKQHANRITTLTLQNIKNRCSVPYDLTIGRSFATYDIDFFRNSKFSYTTFISPPGYGKSILLCHLIQQLFLDKDAVFNRDIVLFLTADQLFHNELGDLSMEHRLLLKLGLYSSTSLIDYFNEQWKKNGTKLIVILDGFSELAINKNTNAKIFDCITNFITYIDNHESIKMVLSMRSTPWSRFYERIKFSHFFKNKWFPGSYHNLNDNTNVPPLTELEVEEIFHKMSPADFNTINDSLKLQLKFPFHIQWYYQLKEEYPAFESYTNIVYFEIISRFIQERIYNSTYATEKVLFCKKIIQLTNYGRKGYTIDKTDLIKEMPVFKNAYNELLINGILMEETQLKSGIPTEFVRFIQPHIFEYFLFTELYDVFNRNMDKEFFESINNEYFGNHVRFQLLQWSVRLMVKLHKLADISAVLDLNLTNYEKNYLIYFIAENLNYHAKQDPKLIEEIHEQGLHGLFIKKMVHFDFVDSCYRDAVKCLLEVAQNERTQIFYHTILGFFDCLSLNQEKIAARLKIIAKFSTARREWLLDPYEVIHAILLIIQGVEPIHNKSLEAIDDFLAKPVPQSALLPDAKNLNSFLMILLSNLFRRDTRKIIETLSTITDRYPKIKKTRYAFSIHFLCASAYVNAYLNTGKKAEQMESILGGILSSPYGANITQYTQTFFSFVKALQCKNRKECDEALRYAKECLSIYRRNEITIREIDCYELIVELYYLLKDEQSANCYQAQLDALLKEKKVQLPNIA